jgi:hypothetical protein
MLIELYDFRFEKISMVEIEIQNVRQSAAEANAFATTKTYYCYRWRGHHKHTYHYNH